MKELISIPRPFYLSPGSTAVQQRYFLIGRGGKKGLRGGCREINKEAKRAAHMHHHVRAHFRLCRESISGIVGIVLQSAGRSCDRHAAPARVLIETSVAAIGMNRTKDTVPSNAL